MVLHNPAAIDTSPLRLADVTEPTPADHDIVVRVEACGICRTDLHVIEGDLPPVRERIVPGHQVVGVVDSCGRAVSRFKPGDRAGIAWLRYTCGTCRYCMQGKENLCPNARFTGYHEDGGFAQLARVHEDFAYVIPRELNPAVATPLLCAGIIGYRALRQADMRPAAGSASMGLARRRTSRSKWPCTWVAACTS